MLVIRFFGKVVNPGTVSKVNVVQVAQVLQHIEGPIDRRLVDPHPGLPADSFQDIEGAHVLFVRRSQHLADRPSRLGNPERLPAQCADQVVGCQVHDHPVEAGRLVMTVRRVDGRDNDRVVADLVWFDEPQRERATADKLPVAIDEDGAYLVVAETP